LAGSLALALLGGQARPQRAGQQDLAQQAIPDAPKPQISVPTNGVAPGQGTTSSTSENDTQQDTGTAAGAQPSTPTPGSAQPAAGGTQTPADQTPTYEPAPGQGLDAIKTIREQVNVVEIPFTVKDSKGQLVSGLKARDIQVYENGLRQHVSVFTDEALPLSVALVIDQSMSQDDMTRVNDALGSLQDAFSPFDEVSVFTYNKSPRLITAFTGAQSPRLTQAIERSKGGGRDSIMAGSLSGPMSCTTCLNNYNVDPNTAAVRGQTQMQLNPPREIHPLNDAILAAAATLSNRPLERRRIIYVISDGKEYGSQAKTSQVEKYLLANGIEVDGTLVGDSAIPYLGVVDKIHLPLMMRDNALVAYQKATGGNLDSEFRVNSIEKSFARVAGEARNRYTVEYHTHEPFIDGKYRKVEVIVMNHGNNLTVLAKGGYWPAAMELRQAPAAPPTQ
jgi:VWFA-related protein